MDTLKNNYTLFLSIAVMFKILSLENKLSNSMDSHACLEQLIKSIFFPQVNEDPSHGKCTR